MDARMDTQLPPIVLTRSDCEKLARIADAAAQTFPRTADFLAREVERAQVVEDVESVPGLVKMGSLVTFRDTFTGQVRTVTLVYPPDADVNEGKISVLTPVGAALIGLSVGQTIAWQAPHGGERELTVLAVES